MRVTHLFFPFFRLSRLLSSSSPSTFLHACYSFLRCVRSFTPFWRVDLWRRSVSTRDWHATHCPKKGREGGAKDGSPDLPSSRLPMLLKEKKERRVGIICFEFFFLLLLLRAYTQTVYWPYFCRFLPSLLLFGRCNLGMLNRNWFWGFFCCWWMAKWVLQCPTKKYVRAKFSTGQVCKCSCISDVISLLLPTQI